MKIIFGLGNRGFWYRKTRHNIGFMACKEFAGRNGWKFRLKGHKCRYLRQMYGGTEVLVALPQTYMNRSGEAVAEILAAFPAARSDVLVVVDDFQIGLGSLRLRARGSSGGHNGLTSIVQAIGEDFCRLRLGIGPKPEAQDVIKFVLGSFKRNEKKAVAVMINNAAEAIETFIKEGIEKTIQKHNCTVTA